MDRCIIDSSAIIEIRLFLKNNKRVLFTGDTEEPVVPEGKSKFGISRASSTQPDGTAGVRLLFPSELESLGRSNGCCWHGDSVAGGEHTSHACMGHGIMSNERKLRASRISENVGVRR